MSGVWRGTAHETRTHVLIHGVCCRLSVIERLIRLIFTPTVLFLFSISTFNVTLFFVVYIFLRLFIFNSRELAPFLPSIDLPFNS